MVLNQWTNISFIDSTYAIHHPTMSKKEDYKMNSYIQKTNGEKTWDRYDFVKFLDGDSVITELNKTMADVVFQTIVNNTLLFGVAITESKFNKFGYIFDKMMTSKITISCLYCSESLNEVLNFATSVTGYKRYLNLKRLFTFVTENNITIGNMKEMEDNDNKFGFFSIDDKWAFECEREQRRRRR